MIGKKTHAKGRVGNKGAGNITQYGGKANNKNPFKKTNSGNNVGTLNDWGGAPNNENPYAIK